MGNLLGDIRYGARMLARRPGLSALAVAALALGIGLTTTMFSIVYAAVLKGLPYERADRLVAIFRNRPAQGVQFLPVSIHDFFDWRDQQQSFEPLAAYYLETINVAGPEGRPIRYYGAYTTANLFEVLRVGPVLGRTFRAEDDRPGAPQVIVLSYRAWRDRFGGDPAIVGRSVRANAELATIVGVMPQQFDFPGQSDAWLPLRIDPRAYPRGSGPAFEHTQLQAIGRLHDGRTVEGAQAELSTIAQRIAAAYPDSNAGISVTLIPQNETFVGRQGRALLLTMLAAVFGVLLIACANVANLLLARTAVRTREIAIRMALGADRLRTIGQLLVETAVLAVVGALAGLAVAKAGISLFNASTANLDFPIWLVARFDPPVLVFVLGLTIASALAAGLVPALRASRGDFVEALNDEARGSSGLRIGRLSRALVVAQVACSCGLLVAAGLMIRTIVNVADFNYGFDTSNVYTARLGLFPGDYPTPAAERQFYDRARQRVAALPGVRQVAYTSDLPARGGPMERLSVDGVAYPAETDHSRALRMVVSPGYFGVFGVRPVAGRDFTDADGADALPVAIVNERFVERFMGDRDPLGRHVRLGDDAAVWRTIVGVVPDMHAGGAFQQLDVHDEGVYVPLAQNVINFVNIIARTEGPPAAHASTIQAAVNTIDSALPLYWVRSLEEQYHLDGWFFRAFGTLLTVFGIAALVLAVVGLYGVMSFSVGQRTREIGVRMALGAPESQIRALVLGQAMRQLAIGLLLGTALAAVLSRGVMNLLFGVRPWDPVIFAIVIAALAGSALGAAAIPARRATRVDPIDALRCE